jgi:short-subunit dehydrogenase
VTTALVTGAAAGIGREFALQLAARGDNLVLVARDTERLEALAEQLRARHGTTVEVLAADLATQQGMDAVAARAAAEDRPIDALVNNAGFGLKQRFVGGDLEPELRMLDVMVRAVLVVTHAAVPGMVARGRGSVITVASVAAFLPGGTYSAIKAWALTFSRGLASELAGTGVTATALCPGFVHTEFHDRGDMNMSSVPGPAWLDAPRVVSDCLRAAARGRAVSIPSTRYRLVAAFLRHVPLAASQAVAGRRPRR